MTTNNNESECRVANALALPGFQHTYYIRYTAIISDSVYIYIYTCALEYVNASDQIVSNLYIYISEGCAIHL